MANLGNKQLQIPKVVNENEDNFQRIYMLLQIAMTRKAPFLQVVNSEGFSEIVPTHPPKKKMPLKEPAKPIFLFGKQFSLTIKMA